MEQLWQRLKTNAIISLILGLLSLTWIVIDYFVLETVLAEGLRKFSLEWILLLFSAAAIVAFHISVFITLYYAFRVMRRSKKLIRPDSSTPAEKTNRHNTESAGE